MHDAYSPLKGARHLDVIQAVREGRPVRPVHVQVILSDLCNQACSFCAYRDPGYSSSQLFRVLEPGKKGLRKAGHEDFNFNPNRMIAYDKAIEILDDCRDMGVQGIQFTGGGEPTVHPEFPLILSETRRRGLSYAVVTNGVNVTKRNIAGALAKAAWVRVSLDAGTPGTYQRIRNVPDWHWEYALNAIRAIRTERDRQGTDCVIGVGFVVTQENWREVVPAVLHARDNGADNVRISAQFSADDELRFAGFHEECAALCREAERAASDAFQVYNRFGAKLDDLKQRRPDYDRCAYQHFTTYIGADLNVYRCCVTSYHPRGIVGSLKEQRFKDLWLSQERADAMAEFKATGCDRCQFNTLNRNLNYMVQPDEPLHSEFV